MKPNDHLTGYLTDVHAIEAQALQQLDGAPEMVQDSGFASILREHLRETEGHEQSIRRLLEGRGESPSTLKDLVLRIGGEGFGLFARSQTDTTGKLASHSLAYEALEWASYDLLARTADRVGEEEVAREARRIRSEELEMMHRIEELLDRTATSAIDEAVTDDVQAHLQRYLADAHAIEAQSIELLAKGRDLVDRAPRLARIFREHEVESQAQRDALERRLEAWDDGPSLLKDAAMKLGALNWAGFFAAHPDTPGKLAAFAYALEHLEIAGYEQLLRVAQVAGDADTVEEVDRILEEERGAAERIRGAFDEAVEASLAALD